VAGSNRVEPELVFILTHPEATAFGILNGARILASYDRRDVVLSKYEAAQWALDTLPSNWHDLLRAAVRTYERAPRELDDAALREGWTGFVTLVRAEIPAK
jgi:streptomycin 3"-adenylyltransferase